MRLIIDLDVVLARIKARRAREAELRRRGLVIFKDWLKARRLKKGRRL